jgi:hypothetical protein
MGIINKTPFDMTGFSLDHRHKTNIVFRGREEGMRRRKPPRERGKERATSSAADGGLPLQHVYT